MSITDLDDARTRVGSWALAGLLCWLPTTSSAATLVDDFEAGAQTNALGGAWIGFSDPGSTHVPSAALDFASGHSSRSCGHFGFLLASGTSYPYVGVATGLDATGGSVDLSQFIGVRFWAKGAGSVVFAVGTTATMAESNHYAISMALGSDWDLFQFGFSELSQTWGTQSPFDPKTCTLLQWTASGAAGGTGDVYLDDVELFTAAEANPEDANPIVARPKVNQLGYLPESEKHFTVTTTGAAPAEFRVLRETDDTEVLTGLLSGTYDERAAAGETVARGDFSSLNTPGRYYVAIDSLRSAPFEVATSVYDALYRDAIRAFFIIRSGVAIDDAQTGVRHAASHTSDALLRGDPSQRLELTGGWYNAGDFGKWSHMAAISSSYMLWLYELATERVRNLPLGIPESGDQVPDLLDQARWGLEWLLKMQLSDGSVLHKVDTEPYFAWGLSPEDDPNTRYASAAGTIDTADFAAVMTQAARVLQPFDSAFAARCAEAGRRAFAWVDAQPAAGTTDPYYTDSSDVEERLWSLAERAVATQDPALLARLEQAIQSTSPMPVSWMNPALLGYLSVARSATVPSAVRDAATSSITAVADRIETLADSNGYGVSLAARDYYWGSVENVLHNAAALVFAHALTGNSKYLQGALVQMDYVLGVNSLDRSFVTHYGENPVLHPYHWTAYALHTVMPGWASGGPNSGAQGADLPLQSVQKRGTPPAKCFVDQGDANGSAASNEGQTTENAVLSFVAGYLMQSPALDEGQPDAGGNVPAVSSERADRRAAESCTCSVPGSRKAGGRGYSLYFFATLSVLRLRRRQARAGVPLHAPRSRLPTGLLLCGMLVGYHSPAHAATFHVTPAGNDTNPGTEQAPFLTIQHCATVVESSDTCRVHAGVYRETVVPAHSGVAGSPIRFEAAPGECVTVSGTEPLQAEWSRYSDSIWRAQTSLRFTQLFVNGKMLNEARWPNADPDDLVHMPRSRAGAGSDTNGLVASEAPPGDWTGAYVFVLPGQGWQSQTRKIVQYDATTRRLVFEHPVDLPSLAPRHGNYYYLFGSLLALDSQGEWFNDTANDWIYIWPPGDRAPDDAGAIEVKQRAYAFDVTGLSYIEIAGFHLFGATIRLIDVDHCIVDGIRARYVTHLRETDGYATLGDVGMISGSNNVWKNSVVAESASSGIYIEGNDNQVANNIVHDVAYMATNHAAIDMSDYLTPIQRTQVLHNTIARSGRGGIYMMGASAASVLYNRVQDVALLSEDMGGIYAWGTDGAGTEVAYNEVSGVHAIYGTGVYLDEGARNFSVHHNYVHDVAFVGTQMKAANLILYNTTEGTGVAPFMIGMTAAGTWDDVTAARLEDNLYDGRTGIQVALQTQNVADFGYFAADLSVDGDWAHVTVGFDALAQPNWAASVPLDLSLARVLTWSPQTPGQFEFEIDNIRFEGPNPVPLADFESSGFGSAFGGSASGSAGAGSTIAVSLVSPGAANSGSAVHATGTCVVGGWASLSLPLTASGQSPYDISDFTGVSFDVRATTVFHLAGNGVEPVQQRNAACPLDTNRIPTTSCAIDQGEIRPPLTDGYAGDLPDLGAYESGLARWNSGAELQESDSCSVATDAGLDTDVRGPDSDGRNVAHPPTKPDAGYGCSVARPTMWRSPVLALLVFVSLGALRSRCRLNAARLR